MNERGNFLLTPPPCLTVKPSLLASPLGFHGGDYERREETNSILIKTTERKDWKKLRKEETL